MQESTASLIRAFAPAGRLRASINLGNPLLANRAPDGGGAAGISIDLARELARRLGLQAELLLFDKAQESVEAVESGRADIGFFAIDPKRGEKIAFSAAYVDIEGSYLVRAASPLNDNDEVDRPGQRVVVGAGSAYDLYLSRTLKNAQIVRARNSQAVVDTFLAQDCEVAAGVRQQLEADAARVAGVRLLPGRFMVIHQAMGIAKSRGSEAHAFLRDFIEAMKAEDFVSGAIARHRIEGVSVAAAAGAGR